MFPEPGAGPVPAIFQNGQRPGTLTRTPGGEVGDHDLPSDALTPLRCPLDLEGI